MARPKKCKKCDASLFREKHKVGDYNITILRCKCGWELLDVTNNEGESLKAMLGKDTIEKMLRSRASILKL